mmetsp:Transcript_11842/g.44085  ORF Transcript_11842/g.44085 Transcript_11842/m.44085 type:complete len:269 (+) Transcript_11842:2484-3290(+)
MAPESSRVKGEPSREKPHLGRNASDALPLVQPKQREPELGPTCGIQRPAVPPDVLPPSDAGRVFRRDAQEAEGHVVEDRPKHGRRSLDVRSPASVALLVAANVSNEAVLVIPLHRSVRDVERANQPRQEEVRTAIVSGPVAVLALQHLIVLDALARGVKRGCGHLVLVWVPAPAAHPLLDPLPTKDPIPGVRIPMGAERRPLVQLALVVLGRRAEQGLQRAGSRRAAAVAPRPRTQVTVAFLKADASSILPRSIPQMPPRRLARQVFS